MAPKVLLDLDGCVVNFVGGFSEYLNEHYGTTLNTKIEPTQYELSEWGGGMELIDTDEATINWIVGGGFRRLKVFPGAKRFVDKLSKLCDISIVTARIGDWDQKLSRDTQNQIKSDTIEWLKDYGLPTNALHFCHKKIDFCKANSIFIMVEDKLETALLAAKEKIDTVLIDHNYNHCKANRLRVYRVFNYDDALKEVKKLL